MNSLIRSLRNSIHVSGEELLAFLTIISWVVYFAGISAWGAVAGCISLVLFIAHIADLVNRRV